MLKLGRSPGQEIIIGDVIKITVLEIRGGYVWLGIDAPREIPVHRKEVQDQITKQEELHDEQSS